VQHLPARNVPDRVLAAKLPSLPVGFDHMVLRRPSSGRLQVRLSARTRFRDGIGPLFLLSGRILPAVQRSTTTAHFARTTLTNACRKAQSEAPASTDWDPLLVCARLEWSDRLATRPSIPISV
jgi:hypothetical protein